MVYVDFFGRFIRYAKVSNPCTCLAYLSHTHRYARMGDQLFPQCTMD